MKHSLFLILLFPILNAYSQSTKEAKAKLATPNIERTAYDVHHYHIDLDIDIEDKAISGSVKMDFTLLNSTPKIGVDLDDKLTIDSITYLGKPLEFKRTPESREVLITIDNRFKKEESYTIETFYHGQPQEAIKAPWDGGVSWKKDKNNNPWIGVSCEGDGASIWWPNKDLLSDEPDSVTFTCRYPKDLFFVANGDMVTDIKHEGYRETTWKTTLPINNYNVTLNIANYTHIEEVFRREENASQLRLDYYVLSYNKDIATEHFKIVGPMMAIFENAFGEYPFEEDGYALVETPYLGMEHQSAIAYGNQYKPGYLGRYPKHMDFDFIVIHETGHEWWGNSVSMNDRADMWIHESFCTYSEAIFAEHYYGYDHMVDYLVYQKDFIENTSPIQGIPHQHKSGHGTDIYYKGSWVLHTLRNMVNNDELWNKMIKDLALKYRINNVDGKQVKAFIAEYLNMDLDAFFDVYFNSTTLPTIIIKEHKDGVKIKMAKKYGFSLPFNWNNTPVILSNKWVKLKKANKEDVKKQLNRLFLIKQV